MKKNISLPAISLVLSLWMLGIDKEDIFKKIPQDPTGPEYTYGEFCEDFALLEECAHMIFEDRFNQKLPTAVIPIEPIEPDITEPGEELIGTYNMRPYTRIPGNPKSCGRVPTDFHKHDYPVKFVFNNGCGGFTIPTAKKDYVPHGKEHYVYWAWEKGSPAVFTKAGCTASYVTAYKVIS